MRQLPPRRQCAVSRQHGSPPRRGLRSEARAGLDRVRPGRHLLHRHHERNRTNAVERLEQL